MARSCFYIIKMDFLMKSYNINKLLETGRWVEFHFDRNLGFESFYKNLKFIVRLVDATKIKIREIDTPHELRTSFDTKTHHLFKVSIDVVNKSINPFDLKYQLEKLKIYGDDGKCYDLVDDTHLLRCSKYSEKHRLQSDFICNPNITYRSGIVIYIPKEIKNIALGSRDLTVNLL